MSGTNPVVDLSQLIAGQTNTNQLLAQMLQTLRGGVIVQTAPPSYTVVTLPPSAAAGATVWASNGRKPLEGAGLGSGVPVFWNPATSQWFSYLSGAVVTS